MSDYKSKQRENENNYKFRGKVIHLTCVINTDHKTGRTYRVVVDGQYEPHGGSRPKMTKAEKKALKKTVRTSRILAQIEAGNAVFK